MRAVDLAWVVGGMTVPTNISVLLDRRPFSNVYILIRLWFDWIRHINTFLSGWMEWNLHWDQNKLWFPRVCTKRSRMSIGLIVSQNRKRKQILTKIFSFYCIYTKYESKYDTYNNPRHVSCDADTLSACAGVDTHHNNEQRQT